jgi:fructose-bisphosphate aldolase class I
MSASPYRDELIATAKKLTTPGKGLLAADESHATIGKRFEALGIPADVDHRRAYREMLFTTPGLKDCVSGVILFEETLDQSAADGTPFVTLLTSQGIVPGIKTDKGLVDLPGFPGEQWTQGLDGLDKRCAEYYKKGARFCKWRNVYKIQNGTVSQTLLLENARTLARQATIAQMNGLCPIVEPEVLIDGAHDVLTTEKVATAVMAEVTKALHDYGVLLEGMLLKPNFVAPGVDCATKYPVATIAEATVRVFARTLPASVPGIMFLSGGISETDASAYLNEINRVSSFPRPWYMGFSYARALQSTAMKVWGGKPENVKKAQEALYHRAKMNSLATLGKYDEKMDGPDAKQSLYVSGYTY